MFTADHGHGASAPGERSRMGSEFFTPAGSFDAFAEAVVAVIKRRRPRPFAAFRGDVRPPMRRRAKPGKAGRDRALAMSIFEDRASSVAKLERRFRIFECNPVAGDGA